jgi:hypothetical protein
MLPPLLDKSRSSSTDKWLWAFLGALVVGQVAAIWMLCQQQVDNAQARQAVLRVERFAAQDECAPRNGRATCMPADLQKRAADVNTVMAALR